jgi:hypothetical protein
VAVTDDRSVQRSEALRRTLPTILVVFAAALLVLGAAGGPASAAAKGGGKIRACVIKHGHDKGVMRFVRGGKCHRGEKKLTWNRKGKHGAAGEPGPRGPTGITDDLLNTITLQQAKIDALTQQLAGLTSQLNTVTQQLNGLSPQVAALCTQMTAVTGQSNALRTVLSGLALTGTIPVGLLLNIPVLPGALGPFSCPQS